MLLAENHFFFNAAPQIRELCRSLKQLHVHHFSYTKTHRDGKRVYLTTHPLLLQEYFRYDFYRIGNCEHAPENYQSQMLLWSSLPKQFIYEQARQFNIGEGLFIIYPHGDYTEFFNFATTIDYPVAANLYLNKLDRLKNFIEYFRYEAAPLIIRAEAMNLILPYQADIFNSQNEILSADLPLNSLKLSMRQHQCADFLLKGLTTKEIAKHLQLSPRTVETYISHLKNKLGATNKSELLITLIKYRK